LTGGSAVTSDVTLPRQRQRINPSSLVSLAALGGQLPGVPARQVFGLSTLAFDMTSANHCLKAITSDHSLHVV
jgi:hypothetical protein